MRTASKLPLAVAMRRLLLLALTLLSWSASVEAAVTFDSTFEKGANSASPFSFVSNAGTVAGSVGANSNRVLIAYLALRGVAASTATMTWNGVAMTQIGTVQNDGNTDAYLFGLIAPATGAQTLAATWTGGAAGPVVLGAVSVYDADQTTGWQNNGTDSGTGSPASSVVTSANGNMAIAGHANNNGASTAISAGTSAWNELAFDGNYAMGYRASTGASTTITWTFTGSVVWLNLKVDVIAFSGGGGAAPKRLLLLGCCEARQ